MKLKRNTGITLIALVVTIIVLLILAGVTLSLALNSNGIFQRSKNAAAAYSEAEEAERAELDRIAGEMDELLKENEPEVKSGTTPFLPEGAIYDETDWTKGITIKDNNKNEWVWIVVPNDGTGPNYSAVETADDKDKAIEEALRAYVAEDNFIVEGTSSDSRSTTTYGYTDTYVEGKGISEIDYNSKKSKMLQSIKEHGGFYIGKYETGYELGTATTARENKNDSIETTVYKPVIKKDAYPYNYVTNAQAEELAENLSNGLATTEDGKGSLMFGIQWDLVLKYLKENSDDLTVADLTADSSKWGNYTTNKSENNPSTALTITSKNAQKATSNPYNVFTEITVTKDNIAALLTTGASDTASRLNVYDIAGNLWEWTLEKTSNTESQCARRGGFFNDDGSSRPASYRPSSSTTDSFFSIGFRVSFY